MNLKSRDNIRNKELMKAGFLDVTNRVRQLKMNHVSKIKNQIGLLKSLWANDREFPNDKHVGIDPIIGSGIPNSSEKYFFDTEWGGKNRIPIKVDFQNIVKLRGGEFFYTPSISWLKKLPKKALNK